MITIDLDNKFAIVSDGEVIKLVQKDGRKKVKTVLHRDENGGFRHMAKLLSSTKRKLTLASLSIR